MPTTTTASSAPQSTDGQGHPVFMQPCTAVKLSDNGDILFKMKANEDASVTVSIGNNHNSQITIPMQNLHNGIFEASFSGCTLTGPQNSSFVSTARKHSIRLLHYGFMPIPCQTISNCRILKQTHSLPPVKISRTEP